jgi:hypothetical protein
MVPDLAERARVPEEVSAEAARVGEWEDADSVWVKNVCAPIVVIEQRTKEVPPVIRSNAPSAEPP